MRISLRTLLIAVACVGLAMGQGRMNAPGTVCLALEIVFVAAYWDPRHLRHWLAVGAICGCFLGLVSCVILTQLILTKPPAFATNAQSNAADQNETQRTVAFACYAFQLGTLAGGTLGLIAGQLWHKRAYGPIRRSDLIRLGGAPTPATMPAKAATGGRGSSMGLAAARPAG